jgi:cellulose synthase/poly-beta-1,6-N-acetylglucosamine synthase-like glycosyltransferase
VPASNWDFGIHQHYLRELAGGSVHTDLLVGVGPLILLVIMTALACLLLAYPLWRKYPDDRGDGLTLVLIPPPKIPSLLRAPVLVALFTSLYVVYHSVHGPLSPDQVYASAVARLAETTVRAPAEVTGYLANFSMGLRFLVVGSMVSIALVGRGTCARRSLMALQVGWYLLAMICLDALLTVLEVVLGFPVGPSTLLGGFVAITTAFVALARTLFVSYALPRPSAVPFVSRPWANDTFTLVGVTLAAMATCAAGLALVYHLADPGLRDLLPLVSPLPLAEGTIVLSALMLAFLAKLTAPRRPPAAAHQPPLDVIIPAYNEEDVIVETLRAIDVAASHYGAPVRVILTDDGSTDRTAQLAEETMRAFRFASGRLIEGHHGGKSAALNLALAETSSDIVIRIDADTVIGKWAFHYTPRNFDDPTVGLVEALMWPRFERSLFSRMRLFEELRQFGLYHRTIQIVDGVNVVPGVFTAFRRDVAVRLGGFTVGMNGEDADFTLRFGRLGYSSRLDPKVVVYEDVPRTFLELREQRIRWARATLHVNSRHGPYRAGPGTPQVWFSQTRLFFKRVFAPIRLMLPFYLLLTAIFEGTYRNVILVFLGSWAVYIAAFTALETVLAIGYRQARHLGWVMLFPLWQSLQHVFSAECWLTLPGRPAGSRGAKPVVVKEAVVH